MNEWQEWRKRAEKRQVKKEAALTPPPDPTSKKEREQLVRTSITEEQRFMVKRLIRVNFTVGSGDRRFIEGLKDIKEMTARQAWWLRCLWYRYRTQLGVNPQKPEGYK
jgi:hypothetical protein